MAGGPQLPASSLSPLYGPIISTFDERAVSRQQKATQELELGNQVDNMEPFQLMMPEKNSGGQECRPELCEQSYGHKSPRPLLRLQIPFQEVWDTEESTFLTDSRLPVVLIQGPHLEQQALERTPWWHLTDLVSETPGCRQSLASEAVPELMWQHTVKGWSPEDADTHAFILGKKHIFVVKAKGKM